MLRVQMLVDKDKNSILCVFCMSILSPICVNCKILRRKRFEVSFSLRFQKDNNLYFKYRLKFKLYIIYYNESSVIPLSQLVKPVATLCNNSRVASFFLSVENIPAFEKTIQIRHIVRNVPPHPSLVYYSTLQYRLELRSLNNYIRNEDRRVAFQPPFYQWILQFLHSSEHVSMPGCLGIMFLTQYKFCCLIPE